MSTALQWCCMRCIAMSEPSAARTPQVFGFGALERVLPVALIVGALLACMLPFMQVAAGYHVIAWSGI